MTYAIHQIATHIDDIPKYISVGGLTLSVACFAVSFFHSLSSFLLFGVFTVSFAVSTYREYNLASSRVLLDQTTQNNLQMRQHLNTLRGTVSKVENLSVLVRAFDAIQFELQLAQRQLAAITARLHHTANRFDQFPQQLLDFMRRAIQGAQRPSPLQIAPNQRQIGPP